MPKHIVRLLILMVAFAAAALYAKSYFTVDSFYRFGHYRADSVADIASLEPVFQTPAACSSCHALRHAEWSANAHRTVICEVCHGAAQGHPAQTKVPIPAETLRLCTQCHEAMVGRPLTSVRQVATGRHFPGADCIACHNPHAPKIGAAVQQAADLRAGHDLAANCAACHGTNGMSPNPDWPNLAGQSANYLMRALASFKIEARKNETMGPMAQQLDNANVRNLAFYFAALSCTAPAARTVAPSAGIIALVERCAICHGKGGRGSSNPSLPKLAGQNSGYLVAAIKAFKTGERSNPIMSEIAAKLDEADISGVAAYFAAQNCGTNSRLVSR